MRLFCPVTPSLGSVVRRAGVRCTILGAALLILATALVACGVGDIETGAVSGTAQDDGAVDGPDAGYVPVARRVKDSKSCGNGKCNGRETCDSCPQDCGECTGPVCGNGDCDAGEDCVSCEADCGACGPVCGNGDCEAGEDCASCEADCGVCGPVCGNGNCEAGEDCASCEADCGVCGEVCGDSVCSGNNGETCTSCAGDCNTREEACGNGECQGGETSSACYPDCGPATWPSTWRNYEEQVLALINDHRAAGTDCPEAAKSPAGPLTMNANLREAARLHSWDQSYSGYFSHTSCNGRSPWQRASAAGTSASGETIGWGYSSPSAIVSGWMSSNGHCNILMGGSYSEIGVGYAQEGSRLWTAMFR